MTDGELEAQGRVVARLRQKGDSLRQRGDIAAAQQAYAAALESVDAAIKLVSGQSDLSVGGYAVEGVRADCAAQVADLFGVRGGLLRRLEQVPNALASYQLGAALERAHRMAATYNRANAIKLGLLDGALTLAEAKPHLVELRDVLGENLRTDERLADNAWLWADLADCYVLLGEVEEAQRAYRVFAQKAETRSPATTLRVLRELATSLTERGDKGAADLEWGLLEVEVALRAA